MVVRVIDVETTGIDPATDAIVQIASVDLVRGGGITNQMTQLVNPGRPIPPVASAVHHIIDADVATAPPITEAVQRFKGADAYVAHNAQFDSGFLAAAGLAYPTWVCTFKVALRLWPDLASHSNQCLRYSLGLVEPFGIKRDLIKPHDAISDVTVTAAVLQFMMEMATWADMRAWSDAPALHTRFRFGKHNGQRFDEVPADYLDWVIAKSDLSDDIKYSARYWLQQRKI